MLDVWGGAYNGSIYLWDDRTHEPVREIVCHGDAVRCLTFLPDMKYVVAGAGSRDGSITVWKSGAPVVLRVSVSDGV